MHLERRLRFVRALLGERGLPGSGAAKNEAPSIAPSWVLMACAVIFGGWAAVGLLGVLFTGPAVFVCAYFGFTRPVARIVRAHCERQLGLPPHPIGRAIVTLSAAIALCVVPVCLVAFDVLPSLPGNVYFAGVWVWAMCSVIAAAYSKLLRVTNDSR